jgi:hypothetical protein
MQHPIRAAQVLTHPPTSAPAPTSPHHPCTPACAKYARIDCLDAPCQVTRVTCVVAVIRAFTVSLRTVYRVQATLPSTTSLYSASGRTPPCCFCCSGSGGRTTRPCLSSSGPCTASSLYPNTTCGGRGSRKWYGYLYLHVHSLHVICLGIASSHALVCTWMRTGHPSRMYSGVQLYDQYGGVKLAQVTPSTLISTTLYTG